MWGLGHDCLEVKLTLKRREILRRVQVARRTEVCARSDQWRVSYNSRRARHCGLRARGRTCLMASPLLNAW